MNIHQHCLHLRKINCLHFLVWLHDYMITFLIFFLILRVFILPLWLIFSMFRSQFTCFKLSFTLLPLFAFYFYTFTFVCAQFLHFYLCLHSIFTHLPLFAFYFYTFTFVCILFLQFYLCLHSIFAILPLFAFYFCNFTSVCILFLAWFPHAQPVVHCPWKTCSYILSFVYKKCLHTFSKIAGNLKFYVKKIKCLSFLKANTFKLVLWMKQY